MKKRIEIYKKIYSAKKTEFMITNKDLILDNEKLIDKASRFGNKQAVMNTWDLFNRQFKGFPKI